MEHPSAPSISAYFGKVEDPRTGPIVWHKLIDIITIAICGVICGADSWVDIELFGKSKERWLKKFLELPNGIPSHDTFGRVFALLDAEVFSTSFLEWVQAVSEVTKGQVVPIDGKTLRRSHDKALGKGTIHMVSAWASENRLVLGQVKVAEKSNEITAIPELLRILDVSGCIVTIDAMGCQKEIVRQIVEQGGDYVLALKENQGQLYEDVVELFAYEQQRDFEGVEHDFCETVNKGHGRIEKRRCWSISELEYLNYVNDKKEWEKLSSVVMVTAQRRIGEETSVESRYYISSLQGNARQLLGAVREHWGIENSVH